MSARSQSSTACRSHSLVLLPEEAPTQPDITRGLGKADAYLARASHAVHWTDIRTFSTADSPAISQRGHNLHLLPAPSCA